MLEAVVHSCAHGTTCDIASAAPSWFYDVTPAIAGVGVLSAVVQLGRIVQSVRLSEESNVISAMSHCAQRYHDIMRDIDDCHYGVKRGAFEPGSWWYRYCDLQTEQFKLFKKGLLAHDVYELWMGELATAYHSRPRPSVETLAQAHRQYLKDTLLTDEALHEFFDEMRRIARETSAEARDTEVHNLIGTYRPRPRKVRDRRRWRAQQRKRKHHHATASPPSVAYQLVADKEEIARRVALVAEQINEDYAERELTVVGVLTGAFVFLADLIRHITIPLEVEFIEAASYGAGTTPGDLDVRSRLTRDLRDRHVLVVDDILDTGRTLTTVLAEINGHAPASLASCVLVAKRKERPSDVSPDYVVLGETPDVFVAGYGIDVGYQYRNKPDLHVTRDGELLLEEEEP